MPGYIKELQRRNVFRVVAAYVVFGWILLQVATNLEEALNLPEWFDAVVTALLIIGFPVAVVFSWVYELTPEGLQKTDDVPEESSVASNTGHRLTIITIAGIALLIGLYAYDRFAPAGSTAPDTVAEGPEATTPSTSPPAENVATVSDKSIAVLPFVAMTTSQDDEFFADGLSEELLNVLAKIDELKVAGRTSSFYYKGRNEDLRDIAEALGVAHILEGSVRRSGDTIRVTAQLIKADDGFHLWSETYDRSDGDIFAIQDEISFSVAQALQTEILGTGATLAERSGQQVEAQNLYLIAQAAVAARGRDDLRQARDLFAQASVLDSENPRYYAGYASTVALQFWNYRDISSDEAIGETSQAIDKALALGEPSADTLAVAGLVEELRALTADDASAKSRALGYYQRAITKEPNNILALQWLASIYLDINRFEDARVAFEKVVALDPLNTLSLTGLANALAGLGRYDEGRLHLYKMAALFPDQGIVYRYLSGLEYQSGRGDHSLYWINKAVDNDPNPFEIYFQVNGFTIFGWAYEVLEAAQRYNEVHGDVDISRWVQAYLDKDFDALAAESDIIFSATGDAIFEVISAWSNAATGNCRESVGALERQYPSLQGEVIEYLATGDLMDAVLLAHCNSAGGNSAESARLLELLRSSDLMNSDAATFDRSLHMVQVAIDAVAGDIPAALNKLGQINIDDAPLGVAKLALPVDELPVYENLYDEELFQQYATRERYLLAEQAKALASGETRTEVVAAFEAAGIAYND